MAYQFVKFTVEAGVGTIVLNRPEVLNSFHRPMGREFQKALEVCRDDPALRAVLITGEGRAFCAGQDLAEAAPPGKPLADIRSIVEQTYNPAIRLIRAIEKPVVCAVNGVAAGAGANIALSCDIVLASEKASFLQAFCHIGLVPDSGGTFFLPRLVGLPRAAAMMLLGEKIPAAEALGMGMIYKVYPPESLPEEALKLARHLAAQPTRGLGLTKRLLNQSLQNDLETQLNQEAELQAAAGATEDYQEGVQAFLEKRKANFKGR
ncbi:MAG: 2-(1,2-epoxy-1,2-dihydrophenyl)acetyl-CoA isomerase [Calditrichaeota bacterium]|nr:2-(1,2-epoxy-1,2-dihydrophenyl)acetyl-CoA isomerase [Calditrichota bacterium]